MDMALETELGVDSIKRVEILSEVQKELSRHTSIAAGQPDQCKALISHLGCQAMPIEQGMAGHCAEVTPYHAEIARIHSMLRVPEGSAADGVAFLSSGLLNGVAPLPPSTDVGTLVANIYNHLADFPATVSAA